MCDCNSNRDRDLIQMGQTAEIRALITSATEEWRIFMATATDRLAALTNVVTETNTQLGKVSTEITGAASTVAAELAALREQIANGTVTEDSLAAAEAAVATLREKVQGLDDLHVDAESPELPPVTEPEAPGEPANPVTDGFGNPL